MQLGSTLRTQKEGKQTEACLMLDSEPKFDSTLKMAEQKKEEKKNNPAVLK